MFVSIRVTSVVTTLRDAIGEFCLGACVTSKQPILIQRKRAPRFAAPLATAHFVNI
jgi:hypothetical protein